MYLSAGVANDMGFEEAIAQNRDLGLKTGQLQGALDNLLALEKTARLQADVPGTKELVVAIVRLCYDAKDYPLLNEHIVLLSKRRAQLKQAVSEMVTEVATYIHKEEKEDLKVELIETVRTITEGKMFVEVDRARLTKTLAAIKEKNGDIDGAMQIMQDTQVEALGGMDKREKTEFILEQVRLCIDTKDFIRAQITANKINIRVFKEGELQDLKKSYYELIIQYQKEKNDYTEMFRAYQQLFDTPLVKEDAELCPKVLCCEAVYLCMTPLSHDKTDQLHRLYKEELLEKLPPIKQLLKMFITEEIAHWAEIQTIMGPTFTTMPDFEGETGAVRMKALHKMAVEHNIEVMAKCYSSIRVQRLAELLALNLEETEKHVSDMVISKYLYARIDRPAGIICFTRPKKPEERLNDWAGDIHSLLKLVETSCHLIHKENMVHKIDA